MNISFRFLRFSDLCMTLAVTSIGLTGCGGGGSDSTSTPAPQVLANTPYLTSASLQGRWSSDSSSSAAYTAIVFPQTNSSSTTQAWVLAQDGSGLMQLTIESNSQAKGNFYSFKGVAPLLVSGNVSLNTTITPKTLSLPGFSNPTTLSQTDTLLGTALLTDVVGNWNGTIHDGSKTLRWTINAASGALAGASSTGCVYNGSLAPVSNAQVFTAVFGESCPDGSATGYFGVTTMSPDGTRLTTVAVANDRSKAIALLLAR